MKTPDTIRRFIILVQEKKRENSQKSFKNHGRLICKEVELFGWMGYIPDEFNYITIDENLGITAWKEQPEYIEGSWENGGSFTFVGWISKDSEEPIDFEECLFELK